MSAERDETFLTVAEVAAWLKLNQQTVRNWIDQGSLPAVRVGRRVRIKRSDLEQILDAGYRDGRIGSSARAGGPSAEDFWSGEPVGMAEPAPTVAPPTSAAERPEEPDLGDVRASPVAGEPAARGAPAEEQRSAEEQGSNKGDDI